MSHRDFKGYLGKFYSEFISKCYPEHIENQRSIVRELQRIYSSKSTLKVVDLGAGTGATTNLVLDQYPSWQVVMLDLSNAMLTRAKQEVPIERFRVEYVVSDALDYFRTVPDLHLDGCYSACTIHNLVPQYRRKLFVELSRTIKPDGFFINVDKYVGEDPSEYRRDLADQIMSFDEIETITNYGLRRALIEHELADHEISLSLVEQKNLLNSNDFTFSLCARNGLIATVLAVKR